MSQLYEFLYVSNMAPGAPISIVADVARKARRFNAAHHITGLLIFDGLRFCQQLEGERDELAKLLDRIRQDPRHAQFDILYQGPLAARRFGRWALAFTDTDDVEVLGRLGALDGQAAMDSFVPLLASLELDF